MESQDHYRSAIHSYLDNQIIKPRNFYGTGFEESLEKIVFNDEPQEERGLIEKVFADRSRTLKSTIKALFNEMLAREHLSYVMHKDIDSQICKTDSYLEQIRDVTKRQYTHDLELAFSGRRTQLESRLLDLGKQARDESLACFKDLTLTSRYLLGALKDYWDISNKANFMYYDENAD